MSQTTITDVRTVAVTVTDQPSAKLLTMARMPATAPLRCIVRGRPPEPRIGSMPNQRQAAALTPPSPWREMRTR